MSKSDLSCAKGRPAGASRRATLARPKECIVNIPHPTASERLASRAGAAPASSPARGFTLIEMLVAIGAVAILTVGIASVFSAIGKTVSGGRRISQLTAQAAQIESVMRQDFARMTRDGFLLIRQQETNSGGPRATPKKVPLSATDTTPRSRRIDEIMFFAKGEFTSSREPVNSTYQATAQAARVYYGHGTRQPDETNPKPPALTDFNTSGAKLGQANTPNQYAGDWTLVRHQCLLVDPRQTKYDMVPVLGLDPANAAHRKLLDDKEGQVALQPAALNIFRALLAIPNVQPLTTTKPPLQDKELMLRTGTRRFSSGLPDTATITLREIRDIVEASRGYPKQITNGPNWYTTIGPDPAGSTFAVDAAQSPPFKETAREQAWMDNAWPTQSDQTRAIPTEMQLGTYGGLAIGVPNGGRIRIEPRPPHLMEVLRSDGNFSSKNDRIASDYRIDQLQLAANGFLKSCSEFIIDWSFGEPDPATGELVWYGLSRFSDLDGDALRDANEPMLTRPYPFRSYNDAPMSPQFTFPFVDASGDLVKGTTADWASAGGDVTVKSFVTPELIYGTVPPPPVNAVAPVMCLNSYFGYLDPTGAEGRPWAWPEFVRVTIKLVDPQDASTEITFQYIFKTPGNGGSKV